jgi:hypothetical protein
VSGLVGGDPRRGLDHRDVGVRMAECELACRGQADDARADDGEVAFGGRVEAHELRD